ncbi:CAP domain-containing protein [Rhodovulum sp. DZ06]|uniref:CAP domain-containing protein n=1 Tax=Rhodovulum sp. DZ06 TaxID=3425126 RepID=UPI003D337C98
MSGLSGDGAGPWVSAELAAAVNQVRAEAGLGALAVHPALEAAALAHARDLLSNGAFDHAGSDGSLPLERVARGGLVARMAAENIAMGQPDAAAAMAAWQGSDGHRANNLAPGAELVGAAEAVYGRRGLVTDGARLWVMVVGAGF